MKTEELTEMADGFKELVTAVKSGEITVENLSEMIKESGDQVLHGLKEAERVLTTEVTGVDSITKIKLLESFKKESENFDYKEAKETVMIVLEVTHALDVELEAEIFLPFMLSIFEASKEIIKIANPDGRKAVKKAVKKFKKNLAEAEQAA